MKKRLSMFLAMIMVFTLLPVSVLAGEGQDITVTGFASLEQSVAKQNASVGTEQDELALPDTLTATEQNGEADALLIQNISWQCTSPAGGYAPNTAGEYVFEAQLPEGYALLVGVEAPKVSVTVADAGEPITIASLDALAEEVLYQDFDADEGEDDGKGALPEGIVLPDTLTGKGEADAALSITGVTWSCTGFSKYTIGSYTFKATLPAGYTLKSGVSLPEITVFIRDPNMIVQPFANGTTTWTDSNVPNISGWLDGSNVINVSGTPSGTLTVPADVTEITLTAASQITVAGNIVLKGQTTLNLNNISFDPASATPPIPDAVPIEFQNGGALNITGECQAIGTDGHAVYTATNLEITVGNGSTFTAMGGEEIGYNGSGIFAKTNSILTIDTSTGGTLNAAGGDSTKPNTEGGRGVNASCIILQAGSGTINLTGGDSTNHFSGNGILAQGDVTLTVGSGGSINITAGNSENYYGGSGLNTSNKVIATIDRGGSIRAIGGDSGGDSEKNAGAGIYSESIDITCNGTLYVKGGDATGEAESGHAVWCTGTLTFTGTPKRVDVIAGKATGGGEQRVTINVPPGGYIDDQTPVGLESGNNKDYYYYPNPQPTPQPTPQPLRNDDSDDDEPVEPVKAGISLTGGDTLTGGIWTGGDLAFTATAEGLTPAQLMQVFVDLDELDRAHYTVKSGSVIVTLKESYLQTLTPGEYVLTLEFTEHIGSSIFRVGAKAVTLPAPIPEATGNANFNPNTGL